jgi:prolyl-tRNA editing enzyme YbaK/EbsC (Cys-tRNA(Pro) deacylase)
VQPKLHAPRHQESHAMTALPPAAQRVQDAADALGLGIRVEIMPVATRTAEEAAAACKCTAGQIAKSLVFKGKDSGKAYLLLVSGANRVDEAVAAVTLGEAITRPDAAFVREQTGFAIGGVSPVGHVPTLVPYIDADLLQYETVWAAAGTPNSIFAVSPAKLRDATGAVVMKVR